MAIPVEADVSQRPKPHNPFIRVIKQQELHTKEVLFHEKGNNCRTVEQDLPLSFLYSLLITLACTIYIPHRVSFVYDYLGRAPALWCKRSEGTAEFSASTATSREGWRGGGGTAPASRPAQHVAATSQVTGTKLQNVSSAERESSPTSEELQFQRSTENTVVFTPHTGLFFHSKWKKMQTADTVWTNITVSNYKYLVRRLTQKTFLLWNLSC